MLKLFDLNSPIMRFMSRVTDLVFLSILWCLCCLPIFTIGPATAAMCFVAMKLARKEDLRVGVTFFQSFKVNFKQGVALQFIFMLVGAVLVADIFYFGYLVQSESIVMTLIRALLLALGAWFLCVVFYTFPLQAQFYNPIRRTLRNAVVLSMQKPINSLIVFLINTSPLIFLYVSIWVLRDLTIFVTTAPLWVLLLPGVLAYLCGMRFVKVFDPFLNPKEENTETEEDEDDTEE